MHVGSAPEAVKLNSADGLPIDGTNPLPTTGGGGGGGSALADVLLTDDTGALFVCRDNGTTVTYFNLNTNAVYTPVGTIYAAPVVTSNVIADELLDGMQTLLIRLLNATNSPRGYDVALGRNRVTALIESGTITTVATVTAVNGVANIGSIGNQQAQLLTTGQNVSAWAATVRSRIT
jgi:hypothetical protein